MGQEFVIKSKDIEDKINQLLPSQGGFQAGVDFSASTTVIPIVDLTETAEGSLLRQDLQRSFSLNSISAFNVRNGTSTIVSGTGYYRFFGNCNCISSTSANRTGSFDVTDGTTTKRLLNFVQLINTTPNNAIVPFDFIVFLEAGDSVTATSSSLDTILEGSTRQIADLQGNLVNP